MPDINHHKFLKVSPEVFYAMLVSLWSYGEFVSTASNSIAFVVAIIFLIYPTLTRRFSGKKMPVIFACLVIGKLALYLRDLILSGLGKLIGDFFLRTNFSFCIMILVLGLILGRKRSSIELRQWLLKMTVATTLIGALEYCGYKYSVVKLAESINSYGGSGVENPLLTRAWLGSFEIAIPCFLAWYMAITTWAKGSIFSTIDQPLLKKIVLFNLGSVSLIISPEVNNIFEGQAVLLLNYPSLIFMSLGFSLISYAGLETFNRSALVSSTLVAIACSVGALIPWMLGFPQSFPGLADSRFEITRSFFAMKSLTYGMPLIGVFIFLSVTRFKTVKWIDLLILIFIISSAMGMESLGEYYILQGRVAKIFATSEYRATVDIGGLWIAYLKSDLGQTFKFLSYLLMIFVAAALFVKNLKRSKQIEHIFKKGAL
jgi:hypothetical protein